MREITDIENYLVYLISKCGLSVTLHPMENDSLITFSSLMRFNTHDNPYCALVKSKRCGHERCLAGQRRVFDKMCRECAPFSGVCHAGVFEYVYPLQGVGGIIGFISVSGYRAEGAQERISRLSSELGHNEAALLRAYTALKAGSEDKNEIDTLIYPLIHMLELAYRKETPGEENLHTRIIRYIGRNYSTDIKVEDICRVFGCSRSYFSHTFRPEVGKSFREYLIDLRLENAERLLTLSRMNVTEIAFSVGFSDSNYFSNLFKRRYGVSPLAYRKKERQ